MSIIRRTKRIDTPQGQGGHGQFSLRDDGCPGCCFWRIMQGESASDIYGFMVSWR